MSVAGLGGGPANNGRRCAPGGVPQLKAPDQLLVACWACQGSVFAVGMANSFRQSENILHYHHRKAKTTHVLSTVL